MILLIGCGLKLPKGSNVILNRFNGLPRHWNNKGTSMETLLYMLAEAGEHLLFWQASWVIFMHQHQDFNASWVATVI